MPNYQTPPTAIAGQTLPAADWNAKVRDSIESVAKPPRCRVFRNAHLSIPNAVVTLVTFNAEHHDSDAMWDPALPGRITVPAGGAGIYAVGFTGQFAINGAGGRHVGLAKNGGLFASANGFGSASWYTGVGCSFEIYANAGEYFEATAYQNSGAALNLSVDYPIALWAHRLAV